MDQKFYYVYITTNLLNGKQYIGDRSCTCNPEKDTYIGSGRPAFYNAKIKYGKENFKKEILEFFDTKEDAFNAQEKYIKKYNTLIPNGYNISPKGGHGVKDCWSEESKQKIKGFRNKEIRIKISNSLKNKPHKHIGVTRTEETRKKISLKKLGRITSEKTKLKISDTLKKKFKDENKEIRSKKTLGKNNGMYKKSLYDLWLEKYDEKEANLRLYKWKESLKKKRKERKHSDETKKKISESSKGKKMNDESRYKMKIAKFGKIRGKYKSKIKLNILSDK